MSTKSSLLVTVIVTVFADSSKLAFVTRQLCVVEVCRVLSSLLSSAPLIDKIFMEYPLASISSQAESTVWPNSSLFASHFSCLAVLCVLALLLDADEFDCPDMPLPINPIMKMATTAKIMIFLFNDFFFPIPYRPRFLPSVIAMCLDSTARVTAFQAPWLWWFPSCLPCSSAFRPCTRTAWCRQLMP